MNIENIVNIVNIVKIVMSYVINSRRFTDTCVLSEDIVSVLYIAQTQCSQGCLHIA